MNKYIRTKPILFFMLLLTLLLSGCGNGTNPEKVKSQGEKVKIEENPIVTIEMEDGGIIKIELEPNIAPNTVANFVALVEDHFYDGLIFHRVIPGFMIQGGDPDGNGSGGPGYSIAGEFSSNGVENHLKHERGVISMARTKEPDSAGSQFFIIEEDASHLDNDYAAFGKVTEGMDIVDKIVNVERDAVDKPLTDQVMKKVTIDTMGVTYPEVEKVQ